MKISIFLLILLFSTASVSADGEIVRLKEDTRINESYIMLSDLFSGIKKQDDYKVASSPKPLETMNFDASSLTQIAKGYGINWTPRTGYESIKITRAGKYIDKEIIALALKDALRDKGVTEDYEVSLINTNSLAVPDGTNPEFDFSELAYSDKTGVVAGLLVIKQNDEIIDTLKINAKVYEMVEIPVMKNMIQLGKIITEEDIEYQRIKADKIRTNIALNADELVGKYARRSLKAGQMVLLNDLRMPELVNKGKQVRVIYKRPFMTLTIMGKALDSGSKDEMVRVLNMSSKAVVHAVVVGSNTVVVSGI